MPAELSRRDAKDSVADIHHALSRDGAVVVENLLPRDLLDALNDELEAHVAAADTRVDINPAIQLFFGDRTRHVSGVAGKSRRFAEDVLCHPVLLALCDEVLLPACARYQMNLGHVIDRGPGAQAQMLHRDELVWVHFPRPHPELQLATMIALCDFTRENGATRIVPGSHRWPIERQPEDDEIADAEMPAGSAAIYLGSTIHGAGANTHPHAWRRGLHLSYVLGWLRTEENNYLACPPEFARTLSRQAQELVGYAVHDAIRQAGGYLGMLGLRDPVDLLARDEIP